MNMLIKLCLHIDKDRFMNLAPRDYEGQDLYELKFKRNAFNYNGYAAILFEGAKFNHSCDHNVIFEPTYEKGVNYMVFKTVRDVEAGEELCDNYLLSDKKGKSHQRLKEQYGFICTCS